MSEMLAKRRVEIDAACTIRKGFPLPIDLTFINPLTTLKKSQKRNI